MDALAAAAPTLLGLDVSTCAIQNVTRFGRYSRCERSSGSECLGSCCWSAGICQRSSDWCPSAPDSGHSLFPPSYGTKGILRSKTIHDGCFCATNFAPTPLWVKDIRFPNPNTDLCGSFANASANNCWGTLVCMAEGCFRRGGCLGENGETVPTGGLCMYTGTDSVFNMCPSNPSPSNVSAIVPGGRTHPEDVDYPSTGDSDAYASVGLLNAIRQLVPSWTRTQKYPAVHRQHTSRYPETRNLQSKPRLRSQQHAGHSKHPQHKKHPRTHSLSHKPHAHSQQHHRVLQDSDAVDHSDKTDVPEHYEPDYPLYKLPAEHWGHNEPGTYDDERRHQPWDYQNPDYPPQYKHPNEEYYDRSDGRRRHSTQEFTYPPTPYPTYHPTHKPTHWPTGYPMHRPTHHRPTQYPRPTPAYHPTDQPTDRPIYSPAHNPSSDYDYYAQFSDAGRKAAPKQYDPEARGRYDDLESLHIKEYYRPEHHYPSHAPTSRPHYNGHESYSDEDKHPHPEFNDNAPQPGHHYHDPTRHPTYKPTHQPTHRPSSPDHYHHYHPRSSGKHNVLGTGKQGSVEKPLKAEKKVDVRPSQEEQYSRRSREREHVSPRYNHTQHNHTGESVVIIIEDKSQVYVNNGTQPTPYHTRTHYPHWHNQTHNQNETLVLHPPDQSADWPAGSDYPRSHPSHNHTMPPLNYTSNLTSVPYVEGRTYLHERSHVWPSESHGSRYQDTHATPAHSRGVLGRESITTINQTLETIVVNQHPHGQHTEREDTHHPELEHAYNPEHEHEYHPHHREHEHGHQH